MDSIQSQHDLSLLNSMAVPSTANKYLEIRQISDLELARQYANSIQLDILVLGEGSNLILASQIPALVLKIALAGIKIVEQTEHTALVEIAAGENWHQAVVWCLDHQLFGLENLALIPGTAGAAPVQNIGAYGVELSQFLERLEYFDIRTGNLLELTGEQCQFGYRNSLFKGEFQGRAVITRLWLRLSKAAEVRIEYPNLEAYLAEKGWTTTPLNVFKAVCAIRQSRLPDPVTSPNVGSFFHNPVIPERQYRQLLITYPAMPGYPDTSGNVKVPAAWLIESLGWKGKGIGGIIVSDLHALVLTNPSRQDATAVLHAASVVQGSVRNGFGIQLQIEPRIYPE